MGEECADTIDTHYKDILQIPSRWSNTNTNVTDGKSQKVLPFPE